MLGPEALARTNGPTGYWSVTGFHRRYCVATDFVAVPMADGYVVVVVAGVVVVAAAVLHATLYK